MRERWARGGLKGLLVVGTALLFTSAAEAKTLWGSVAAVKDAEVVTFRHTAGEYQVRINGIDAPEPGQPFAAEARKFLEELALGKDARFRLKYRNEAGEMVVRLWAADKEVAIELLKAGLVWRQPDKDEKYGELSAAELEAREAKRGLWSQPNPTPPWEYRAKAQAR